MIVPIWSICFVKLASAFAVAAELASFCWATSSFWAFSAEPRACGAVSAT
jgi:hypothetical protein